MNVQFKKNNNSNEDKDVFLITHHRWRSRLSPERAQKLLFFKHNLPINNWLWILKSKHFGAMISDNCVDVSEISIDFNLICLKGKIYFFFNSRCNMCIKIIELNKYFNF